MNSIIDYRTDAVTLATYKMRQAMANAEVGDDFSGEDPTVNRLEAMSAKIFGKEAAMFVITGTMANQIAIMTSTHPGDEVLVGVESHIYSKENDALEALSGVQAKSLRSTNGQFDFNDIKRVIRTSGIQSSSTSVLCLENTYDLNRGIPLSAEYISEVSRIAHENNLFVYLDGARIFNTAIALDVEPEVLCRGVDAMQFSLCKALAAPVGCILLGSSEFIERARLMRHRIGGAMAQAGHMAAAGIVALETMIDSIKEDHLNARRLARGLASIDGGLTKIENAFTNILQVDFGNSNKDATYIAAALNQYGIKVKVIDSRTCRFVTHVDITSEDIDKTIEAVRNILSS
jgi:Threonine aldolase